ncbi:helix-turn-helix domain-containing protein [Bacteroides stercoris]|uniref:Helix-turn-helix domain-containing protein n=1 Tax=Bacteroides stercoris TaxID=46506 RepID=A0A413B4M9_BACSE|nr:helix-turn-helix domain-containing protein [Bacteroides stercoris]RGW32825.1 helix-turn-helix domain-containing protein [Bacteroides stercoris]
MDAKILSSNALLIQQCTMNDVEKVLSRLLDEKLANILPISTPTECESRDGLYKRKEAADMLGVSLVTLDTWAKAGIIKSRKIGTRIYYTKNAIDEALRAVNG